MCVWWGQKSQIRRLHPMKAKINKRRIDSDTIRNRTKPSPRNRIKLDQIKTKTKMSEGYSEFQDFFHSLAWRLALLTPESAIRHWPTQSHNFLNVHSNYSQPRSPPLYWMTSCKTSGSPPVCQSSGAKCYLSQTTSGFGDLQNRNTVRSNWHERSLPWKTTWGSSSFTGLVRAKWR